MVYSVYLCIYDYFTDTKIGTVLKASCVYFIICETVFCLVTDDKDIIYSDIYLLQSSDIIWYFSYFVVGYIKLLQGCQLK